MQPALHTYAWAHGHTHTSRDPVTSRPRYRLDTINHTCPLSVDDATTMCVCLTVCVSVYPCLIICRQIDATYTHHQLSSAHKLPPSSVFNPLHQSIHQLIDISINNIDDVARPCCCCCCCCCLINCHDATIVLSAVSCLHQLVMNASSSQL